MFTESGLFPLESSTVLAIMVFNFLSPFQDDYLPEFPFCPLATPNSTIDEKRIEEDLMLLCILFCNYKKIIIYAVE